MEIRLSRKEDLEEIMAIYEHARQFMREHDNPRQWSAYGWPPQELIEKDIEEHKGYVAVENGDIAAVFFYDEGRSVEPTYEVIEGGKWIGDEDYAVVHRIASSGKYKGAGSFCIRWACEKSGHLRMDTHEDNYVMQNCLKKLGFEYCGIIYVRTDHDPRLAYEWIREGK
ncbi:MAG: N-acetyltransferase [Erysipelotrichaceae bacterium]|nr:N-acetyltransferase [Erysipelotrichaceae bacterium]